MPRLEKSPEKTPTDLSLQAANALKTDPQSPISVLIGASLRVYRTGDLLTQDLRSDRANIELDPISERIVRIWLG